MEWVLLLFILYSARIMLKKLGGVYLMLPIIITTSLFCKVMMFDNYLAAILGVTSLILGLLFLRFTYKYVTYPSSC